MTNNDTAIITLTSPGHGIYRVFAAHLDLVIDLHTAVPLGDLHRRVAAEVGFDLDYTDLNRTATLIVLSYLTGGCAD
jgi:hypothetical protein